jgi:hypothetical protein
MYVQGWLSEGKDLPKDANIGDRTCELCGVIYLTTNQAEEAKKNHGLIVCDDCVKRYYNKD